jgi:hypothetical protein
MIWTPLLTLLVNRGAKICFKMKGASKNFVRFLEAPEQILTGFAVFICRLLKTAVFRSPLNCFKSLYPIYLRRIRWILWTLLINYGKTVLLFY